MNVGLYFGTFNPIHIGHMVIANYMVEFAGIDQLWFVVSPQSPFKQKQSMLNDYHRLELVNLAIDDDPRMRSSNIEFKLPKPSYTIDTLAYMQEEYPQHQFSLIMGSDNIFDLPKWKNYELLIENYQLIVYPRPGFVPTPEMLHPHMKLTEAPMMNISSTFIRKAIKDGKNMCHFVPSKAWQYIEEMNFYKK